MTRRRGATSLHFKKVPKKSSSLYHSLPGDFFFQLGDFEDEIGVGVDFVHDGVIGGDDGSVIASEHFTDIGIGHFGHIADKEDGEVTCACDLFGALLAGQILFGDAEFAVDRGEDLVNGHVDGLSTAEELGDAVARDLHRDGSTRNKAQSSELLDRALDLTDVGAEVFTEEGENVVGKRDVDLLCLLFDDRDAELQIRRLNVGKQTPFETGLETVLQRFDVSGRTVGGQNDLLFVLKERVEGVEKLLLRGDLARNELDIVDEKHVAFAVLVAKILHRFVGQAGDHLVGEVLTLGVDDLDVGIVLFHAVDDRAHQVGFTESAVTVDEKRIVVGCGIVGDRDASRVRKLVGASHNEVFKGVFEVVDGHNTALKRALDGIILDLGLLHGDGRADGVRIGGRACFDEVDDDLKAEEARKGVLDFAEIFFGDDAMLEIGAKTERQDVGFVV